MHKMSEITKKEVIQKKTNASNQIQFDMSQG